MSEPSPPPVITPPSGYDEIRKAYGDPAPYLKSDGSLGWSAQWEREYLVRVALPGYPRVIAVNRIVVPVVRMALERALERCKDYKLRSVGCWAVRYKRTRKDQLSLHSWGIAFDINAATNALGSHGDIPETFGKAFEECGFVWGRRWQGRGQDPMHFQLARGA